MKSEAASVAEYLLGVPEDRRAVLTEIRGFCVKALKGCTEGIDYGMPCYKRDGAMVVAFASQKQYISLYGMKGAAALQYRAELGMAAKGCMRFRSADAIDLKRVKKMVEETAKANATGC